MTSFSRTLSATCVAIAALTSGMAAHAQSTSGGYSMYSPGSGYIGLNAGQSDYRIGNGNGTTASDPKDTAYSIYGGSYFNNNFGFEIGYNDFGRITRGGGTTKAEGINLDLVGRLPLSNSFNLLGKVGTTYTRTDTSATLASGVTSGRESDWGWNYGIGVEWAFNPAWSAVLQYDEHDAKFAGGSKDSINVTSVGLRYRF